MLLPKLTTSQRDSIISGDLQNGLLLYNNDVSKFQFYNGSYWKTLCDSCTSGGAGGTVVKIGVINSQTKSANGAVISGDSLIMQTADASNVGLVSTGSQTFAGVKTFSSAPVISSITNTGTLTLPTVTGTIMQYAEGASSSTAPTPTGDARENYLDLSSLTGTTTVGAPSGTAANHNIITIRVVEGGSTHTLAWNAIYRASANLALPTITTANKTMYIKFMYNSTASKWDLLSVLDGF